MCLVSMESGWLIKDNWQSAVSDSGIAMYRIDYEDSITDGDSDVFTYLGPVRPLGEVVHDYNKTNSLIYLDVVDWSGMGADMASYNAGSSSIYIGNYKINSAYPVQSVTARLFSNSSYSGTPAATYKLTSTTYTSITFNVSSVSGYASVKKWYVSWSPNYAAPYPPQMSRSGNNVVMSAPSVAASK